MRSEVEILQDAFGLDKKAAVAKFLDLGEDANAFWTLYDAYEVERKKLGIRRIEVLQEYAKDFANLSDDKITELYKSASAVRQSYDKLLDKYFKLFKKEFGASKAAQFWQLESYINVMIQVSIYTNIPFIGENISNN